MMYMARRSFRKKRLVRWNTRNNRKQSQSTKSTPSFSPFHTKSFTLFSNLNNFVYLLFQVEYGIKDVW